jgi:predicted Zn-dependent peptidase
VDLLSTILGGSMSSRLFQKVREERGLAYSVGSFTTHGSDCGLLSFYGGCRPDNFDVVIGLFLEELKRVTQEPVPEKELRRAIEHQNGAMAMSLESTYGKASAHARDVMLLDKPFDLDAAMAQVEAVDTDQVLEVARATLHDDCLGLFALGDLPGSGPARPWSLA